MNTRAAVSCYQAHFVSYSVDQFFFKASTAFHPPLVVSAFALTGRVRLHSSIFIWSLPKFDLSERKNKGHSGCASERDRKPSSLVSLVTRLCAAHSGKQSRLACAASPIPLLPHSLSPSSLHIVLLPISLSVINYKRHKPPGLMPCHGRLPSCTFWRAKRLASLITPGTLSVSPFTGRRKSPRRALHRPERHQRFLQSADGAYFSEPSAVLVFHFSRPCKTHQ